MPLLHYENMSKSLGEREMLLEREPQESVSTNSFYKFSQTFTSVLQLNTNTDNMFLISFKKHWDEKRLENNLLTLIIKMWVLFAHAIITSTASASSVFLSSCRNKIFNQLAQIFSLECFLNPYTGI